MAGEKELSVIILYGREAEMADKELVEYRALTGINYKNKNTGKDERVEKGETVEGLNDIAVRNELKAGNIELVAHTEKEGE